MKKLKLKDKVKLKKNSVYADSYFQQDGFCHLKVGEVGVVIKTYENDEYLIELIDENVKKANIYSKKDLIKSDKNCKKRNYEFLFINSYSWWLDLETKDVVMGHITIDEKNSEIPVLPEEPFYSIDFERINEVSDDKIQCFMKLKDTDVPVRVCFEEFIFFKLLENHQKRQSKNTIRESYSTIEKLNGVELI